MYLTLTYYRPPNVLVDKTQKEINHGNLKSSPLHLSEHFKVKYMKELGLGISQAKLIV